MEALAGAANIDAHDGGAGGIGRAWGGGSLEPGHMVDDQRRASLTDIGENPIPTCLVLMLKSRRSMQKVPTTPLCHRQRVTMNRSDVRP